MKSRGIIGEILHPPDADQYVSRHFLSALGLSGVPNWNCPLKVLKVAEA